MTMNGAVMPIMAMYIAAAEEQVIYSWSKTQGINRNRLSKVRYFRACYIGFE